MDLIRCIKDSVRVNADVEQLTLNAVLSNYIIIQAKGYPQRYLLFNEIYYNGEFVDEDTKLDINAIGLKEIPADSDWKDNDVTSLIVIPKGTKVELYFEPKDYDEYDETFDKLTINYKGIKIKYVIPDELEEFIESVEN